MFFGFIMIRFDSSGVFTIDWKRIPSECFKTDLWIEADKKRRKGESYALL